MVTSEMPHGGFKQSGSGKDMSTYSFEEYTQVKHVMLELTGEPEKAWHYTIFGDKPGRSGRERPGRPTGRCLPRQRRPIDAWHHPWMPPINELTRIEPAHLERLDRQGIFTTGLLLEVSETPTRRQTLADQVKPTRRTCSCGATRR